MTQVHILILLLAAIISSVTAEAPVFCKCTCFKNSTILPLETTNGKPTLNLHLRTTPISFLDFDIPTDNTPLILDPSTKSPVSALQRRVPPPSCSRCTKNFCLSQGIDFCKTAKEIDVQTLCFQRDSQKDRIIIWGFLLGTTGLLGWAAYKKYKAVRQAKDSGSMPAREEYSRVSTTGGRS